MTSSPRPLALLGPQRGRTTLDAALADLGVDEGPVAIVTAGWQEREADDDEVEAAIGLETVNLGLYERAERVFSKDTKLADGHRLRQQRLKRLRSVYDTRLAHAMATWRELAESEPDDEVRREAEESACEMVRQIDRWHLDHVQEVLSGFEKEFAPGKRKAVTRERKELRSLLRDASALAISGGHVAVLVNRLWLFGLPDSLEKQPRLPVLGWSAGAMILGTLVVLFHDSPPQGPGNAEVFGPGLGLYDDILVFPDGSHRLRIDDPGRVGRLARRFSPRECVLMDRGARLLRINGDWASTSVTGRLVASGAVEAGTPW